MTREQRDVWKWMKVAGQNPGLYPEHIDPQVEQLRIRLLQEELDELKAAVDHNSLTGIADALTDIQVVNLGAACAWGIDLGKCFQAVMLNNWSKFPIVNGKPEPLRRPDGKIIKPPGFQDVDLVPLLAHQIDQGNILKGK